MRNYIKKFTASLLLLTVCALASAQTDSLSAEKIPVKKAINDYWSVGVSYGVTLSRMTFNPRVASQDWLITPNTISVNFTKYCKMFGYMPYFGVEFGFTYGHQGFVFKQDPTSEFVNAYSICTEGDLTKMSYITQERIDIFKIPAKAKFHVDIEPVAITANLGFYGGWRKSIERLGPTVDPDIVRNFMSTDRRFDYGLEGGVGIGFYLDPVEIHFGVLADWSWNSLVDPQTRPDQYSHYYYRFANPLDIIVNMGIAFQLTKRRGKTNKELRQEAYKQVYGNN